MARLCCGEQTLEDAPGSLINYDKARSLLEHSRLVSLEQEVRITRADHPVTRAEIVRNAAWIELGTTRMEFSFKTANM